MRSNWCVLDLLSVQAMAPVEMYANGTGHPDFVQDSLQQPEFYSMATLKETINSAQLWYNVAAPTYSAMSYYDRDSLNENFGGVVPGYAEPLESFGSYPEGYILDSDQSPLHIHGSELIGVFIFSDQSMGITDQDNGYISTLPAPSFESGQVSDSSTLVSGVNQEEDSFEELYNSLKDITSWPAPELNPATEDHSFISASQAMLEGVAKKESTRKRERRVEHSKLTYPCEIRISKKLVPNDGEYLKGKAWLGTFATPDQRGRALDVGKYFLSTKKRKTFYDPNSEKILSACRDRINALPLAERVVKVIKFAKYYGENGLLPQSLNRL